MRSLSVAIFLGIALVHLLGSASCVPLPDEAQVLGSIVTIETVPDIDAFIRANPELTVVQLPATKAEVAEGRQQIVYTLGYHTANERLIGLSSDNKEWSTPQNVKLDLQYPTAGVGDVVSYVEVVVNQSTSNGSGYLVSGGVGQRYVRLVIEAYGTTYFYYQAAIYGY
ncbi:AGAP000570-PA-like protein [Anopheles sinensis]|uniref:AGAP000570-PA-like protein n=1 Tax=Anopheles sinensis TaxID=74873 RepID=A0A084VFM4_ANOSI|nr:AGAP000570-PA-like protein [Anopheles sinensis]